MLHTWLAWPGLSVPLLSLTNALIVMQMSRHPLG